MTPPELAAKRVPEYASRPRPEVIGLLEPPLGDVLDVGCGTGGSAALLRERGARRVVGIEPEGSYATAAREAYDEVREIAVEDELPWAPASFDTVLAYDVLEHLVDPWAALARLRPLLRPGGRLHVAIPNARHPRVWAPLVLRGTVAYEPGGGLRDVTHLRLFARRDTVALVEGAGFRVVRVDRQAPARRSKRLLFALTRGGAAEFLATHWYVLAEPG